MGNDSKVHITALTDDNKINGNSIAISCNDFSDMFAHNDGGVLMLTRAKKSGSESLLNYPPEKPIPCYGMYLVKFNNSGKEIWSKEITNTKLPYTDNAIFVWWYAHHGRIAFSGSNYAAYYGCAISVNGDIHQGDRQTIVSSNGTIKSGGWNWGCSHSGYELVIWDKYKKRFASICKTDNNDRIMYNVSQTIKGIDLWYSNLGSPVPDKKGGYWLVVSDRQNGQPAKQDGYADVHLVHFNPNGKTDKDIIIAGKKDLNERAPHLSAFGEDQLLASWESTTSKGDIRQSDSNRKFFIQSFNISSGKAISKALQVNIRGNRYQDLVSFPDGSAAFVSKGSSITKIKIARFYPDNILTSPDISISGNKNPDQTNNVAKSNSTKNIENIIYVNNNLEVTAKSYNWILTDLNNILVYS